MAVLATSNSITLSTVVDINGYYRYYLLQSSTAAVPAKPTAYPPTGGWTDTEPTYTSGSTNSLYIVDCTEFNDGTWEYSDVSLSSSYEAAKVAYNKAVNAQSAASAAQTDADAAQAAAAAAAATADALDEIFRMWYSFTDEGMIVQKKREDGSSASIWSTVTDNIGFHIRREDLLDYVFSAYRDRCKITKLEIGDLMIKPSGSGGMVWVKK